MLHHIISPSNVTAEQLTKSISLSAIKLTAGNPCSFPQGTALPSISLVQELKKSLPWSYRENQIPCFGSMVCLGRSCPTSTLFPFPLQPGEEGCSPESHGVNAAAHQVLGPTEAGSAGKNHSSPLLCPEDVSIRQVMYFFPQHILRHRLERQIATGDPLPSNAVQLPQPHQEGVLTSFSPTSTRVLQQQHRRQRTPSASSSSRRKLPSPAPEATSSHQGPGREGSSSRSHPAARFLQPSWSSLQPGQVQQQ